MKVTKAALKSSKAKDISVSKRTKVKEFHDQIGLGEFTLTDSQKTLQNIIRNNTLSFVKGPAGTGKTLSVLHYFVNIYLKDRTKQIVVVRTPVESAGKDKVGYLPNDLASKIEPHFASTKKILSDLLSPGKVDADMDKRLHFKIPNYMLGSTLDDTLLLVDEAQMLEPLILKLILERIGEGSICVVMGDSTQVYTNDTGRNGLDHAIGKFFYKDSEGNVGLAKYNDIGFFKFTADDVQRSAIVKTVVKAYSE